MKAVKAISVLRQWTSGLSSWIMVAIDSRKVEIPTILFSFRFEHAYDLIQNHMRMRILFVLVSRRVNSKSYGQLIS